MSCVFYVTYLIGRFFFGYRMAGASIFNISGLNKIGPSLSAAAIYAPIVREMH
jgi:hypothetical protein